jgi:membrane protein DedA with SNARE-associated domain/rhodanese-related sulfurtransferase
MHYYLDHITYPVIFIAVLARQLNVPVPAILFLMSGGALAGAGRLSFAGILVMAVLGSVLADLVWFEAGRIGGKRVIRLLCSFARDPSYCIRNGRAAFEKRGLQLLLIAKFIPGLDGIAPPLAGMLGSSRAHFMLYDAGGSLLWAATYIGGGFLFAEKLTAVTGYIAVYADVVMVVLGVPVLLLFIWKAVLLVRASRLLRPMHITPEQLNGWLNEGKKVGVIDLLRFEEDPTEVPGIPGSVRLEPAEIRRKKLIHVPDDVNVVIYCRSKNSFASARVAVAMRKHGVQKIHLLAGGIEGWKARGFPVSHAFADPKTELARLGVEMTPASLAPASMR